MVDTTLSMSIDAKGVKSGSDTAVRSLDDIKKSARGATTAVDGSEKSIKTLGSTSMVAATALKSLAAAYGVREIIQAADSYNLLNAKIRLVTDSQEQATQVYGKLLKSANENLNSVEASITLYTRLAAATKNYGITQNEVIKITDFVNKTLRISGASAAEAASGTIQFGQALGSGKLAGDEFKSTSENNIRLLNALSDATGKSTGQLRKMAEDGLLTTSFLLDKLPSQFEKVSKESASLPVTVGGSFVVLRNNVLDYIGKTDKATGSTSSLAQSVLLLANNIDTVVDVLTVAGIALAGKFTSNIISSTAALISQQIALYNTARLATATSAAYLGMATTATTASVGAKALSTSLAFFGGPIGLAITGVAAGIYYLSTRTSEYDIALKTNNETIDKARDLKEKLAVASGSVAKKLKEENNALIENTIQAIENTDKLIQNAKARIIAAQNLEKSAASSELGGSFGIATAINIDEKRIKELDKIQIENNKTLNTQIGLIKELDSSKKKVTKTTAGLTKEQEKAIKVQEDLNKKRKELLETTKLNADQSLRLNVANQISEEQYKKVQNAIEIENKLREVGLTIKDEEGKKIAANIRMQQTNTAGIEAGTKAREDANKAAEDAVRLQEELNEKRAQPFIEASKNIQSGIAKSIEDAAKEGLQNGFNGSTIKNTFKSFGDLLKNTIITSIANGLAASLTTGLISPFLGNLATAMNGQAVGGAVNKGLGVGGLSGIGGLASGIFSAGGLAASGGFGAINMFGASTLGTGLPALAGSGVVGSGLLGGATLTGLLGAGAIGLGAGSITSRLFGGNAVGGAIGGAAGGIAGGLAGQALIPIPGVGFVIGSALGGIAGGGLGGLFGAGKAVSAAEFAGNITSTGLSGVSTGAKNGDISQAQGLADSLGSFLSQIVASGINIAATDVRGAINSKSGNRFEVLGQRIGFDPADAQSVANAISKVSIELIKAGDNSGSLAIALQNIQTDGRKAEEVIADLNFAANFDKLGDAPKKLTAVEQAVDALNAQFDTAEETAKRLGLSEEKLTEYRKQQFSILTTEFNKDISAQILAITNPTAASIAELDKSFEEIRKNAAAVGGDLTQVERLYSLKLSKLTEDIFTSQISNQEELASAYKNTQDKFNSYAASLRSFRLGLLTNPSLSPLSNEERFRAAQAQFNSVSSLARLGNEDAINQLQDTSQSYLEAAKEYYGTTAPVFDAVQSALENTESLAVRQANIAGQQLNAANTQIAILTSIRDNLSKSQATGAASNPTKYGTDPKISQINYLLDVATNFKFKENFGNQRFDRFAASSAITDAEREAARNVHRAFGLIPAYANGGDHPGGLRIVGERGAELEATGSSKIITNKTLMEALSGGNNAEIIAAMKSSDQANREELRALRRQLAESDKRNQELIMQLKNNQEKTNSQLISIMTRSNVRAV